MTKINDKIMQMFMYYVEKAEIPLDSPILFNGEETTLDGIYETVRTNESAYAFIKHVAVTLNSQDSYAEKTALMEIVNAFEGAQWLGDVAPNVAKDRRKKRTKSKTAQRTKAKQNSTAPKKERRKKVNTPRQYRSIGDLPTFIKHPFPFGVWSDLDMLISAGVLKRNQPVNIPNNLKTLFKPNGDLSALKDLMAFAKDNTNRGRMHEARYVLAKITQHFHFSPPSATNFDLSKIMYEDVSWSDINKFQKDVERELHSQNLKDHAKKAEAESNKHLFNAGVSLAKSIGKNIESRSTKTWSWFIRKPAPRIGLPVSALMAGFAAWMVITPTHKLSGEDIITLASGNKDVAFASYTFVPPSNADPSLATAREVSVSDAFSNIALKEIRVCHADQMDNYPPAYRAFLINMADKFGDDSQFYQLFESFVEQSIYQYEMGLADGYADPYSFYAMVHRETNAFRDIHNSSSGATGPRQHMIDRFYEESYQAQGNLLYIANIQERIESGTSSVEERNLVNAYETEMANYNGNANYARRMQRNESGNIDIRLELEAKQFQSLRVNTAFVGGISAARFAAEGILLSPEELDNEPDEAVLWANHKKAYDPQLGGEVGRDMLYAVMFGTGLPASHKHLHNPNIAMNNYAHMRQIADVLPSTRNYSAGDRNRFARHWAVRMTENHSFLKPSQSFANNYNYLYKDDAHRITEALNVTDGMNTGSVAQCTGEPNILQFVGLQTTGQNGWKQIEPLRQSFGRGVEVVASWMPNTETPPTRPANDHRNTDDIVTVETSPQ